MSLLCVFTSFRRFTFIENAPLRSLFRYKFNLSCHWLRLRLPLSGRHLSQALDILVSVRSIHCCTYTPDLSTSSSLRCLTRLLYERSHLKAGFTLRCFQRLSFPNVATQLYPWRAYFPKIILIDISLMVVGADAATGTDRTVNQNGAD